MILPVYDMDKMKRLVAQDRFVAFSLKDLVTNRNHTEEEALRIIFDSYILDDSSMEDAYNQA